MRIIKGKTAKGLVSLITIVILLSSILASSLFYENNITANVVKEASAAGQTRIIITEVNDIKELNQLNEGWYQIVNGYVFYLEHFDSYVPLYIHVRGLEQQNQLLGVEEDGNIIFYGDIGSNEDSIIVKNEIDTNEEIENKNQLTGFVPKYYSTTTRKVSVSYKPVPPQYEKFVKDAAKKYNINENLLKSLINVESGYNPKARSNVGAVGLGQLMPATARDLDLKVDTSKLLPTPQDDERLDPQKNIFASARHLSNLYKEFKGDEVLIIAAYNAGGGKVNQFGNIPPYDETRKHVTAVLLGKEMFDNGLYVEETITATYEQPIRLGKNDFSPGQLPIYNTKVCVQTKNGCKLIAQSKEEHDPTTWEQVKEFFGNVADTGKGLVGIKPVPPPPPPKPAELYQDGDRVVQFVDGIGTVILTRKNGVWALGPIKYSDEGMQKLLKDKTSKIRYSYYETSDMSGLEFKETEFGYDFYVDKETQREYVLVEGEKGYQRFYLVTTDSETGKKSYSVDGGKFMLTISPPVRAPLELPPRPERGQEGPEEIAPQEEIQIPLNLENGDKIVTKEGVTYIRETTKAGEAVWVPETCFKETGQGCTSISESNINSILNKGSVFIPFIAPKEALPEFIIRSGSGLYRIDLGDGDVADASKTPEGFFVYKGLDGSEYLYSPSQDKFFIKKDGKYIDVDYKPEQPAPQPKSVLKLQGSGFQILDEDGELSYVTSDGFYYKAWQNADDGTYSVNIEGAEYKIDKSGQMELVAKPTEAPAPSREQEDQLPEEGTPLAGKPPIDEKPQTAPKEFKWYNPFTWFGGEEKQPTEAEQPRTEQIPTASLDERRKWFSNEIQSLERQLYEKRRSGAESDQTRDLEIRIDTLKNRAPPSEEYKKLAEATGLNINQIAQKYFYESVNEIKVDDLDWEIRNKLGNQFKRGDTIYELRTDEKTKELKVYAKGAEEPVSDFAIPSLVKPVEQEIPVSVPAVPSLEPGDKKAPDQPKEEDVRVVETPSGGQSPTIVQTGVAMVEKAPDDPDNVLNNFINNIDESRRPNVEVLRGQLVYATVQNGNLNGLSKEGEIIHVPYDGIAVYSTRNYDDKKRWTQIYSDGYRSDPLTKDELPQPLQSIDADDAAKQFRELAFGVTSAQYDAASPLAVMQVGVSTSFNGKKTLGFGPYITDKTIVVAPEGKADSNGVDKTYYQFVNNQWQKKECGAWCGDWVSDPALKGKTYNDGIKSLYNTYKATNAGPVLYLPSSDLEAATAPDVKQAPPAVSPLSPPVVSSPPAPPAPPRPTSAPAPPAPDPQNIPYGLTPVLASDGSYYVRPNANSPLQKYENGEWKNVDTTYYAKVKLSDGSVISTTRDAGTESLARQGLLKDYPGSTVQISAKPPITSQGTTTVTQIFIPTPDGKAVTDGQKTFAVPKDKDPVTYANELTQQSEVKNLYAQYIKDKGLSATDPTVQQFFKDHYVSGYTQDVVNAALPKAAGQQQAQGQIRKLEAPDGTIAWTVGGKLVDQGTFDKLYKDKYLQQEYSKNPYAALEGLSYGDEKSKTIAANIFKSKSNDPAFMTALGISTDTEATNLLKEIAFGMGKKDSAAFNALSEFDQASVGIDIDNKAAATKARVKYIVEEKAFVDGANNYVYLRPDTRGGFTVEQTGRKYTPTALVADQAALLEMKNAIEGQGYELTADGRIIKSDTKFEYKLRPIDPSETDPAKRFIVDPDSKTPPAKIALQDGRVISLDPGKYTTSDGFGVYRDGTGTLYNQLGIALKDGQVKTSAKFGKIDTEVYFDMKDGKIDTDKPTGAKIAGYVIAPETYAQLKGFLGAAGKEGDVVWKDENGPRFTQANPLIVTNGKDTFAVAYGFREGQDGITGAGTIINSNFQKNIPLLTTMKSTDGSQSTRIEREIKEIEIKDNTGKVTSKELQAQIKSWVKTENTAFNGEKITLQKVRIYDTEKTGKQSDNNYIEEAKNARTGEPIFVNINEGSDLYSILFFKPDGKPVGFFEGTVPMYKNGQPITPEQLQELQQRNPALYSKLRENTKLHDQYKSQRFFAEVERVLTEFQGLGYYATLFIDEDKLLAWRETVDEVFATLYLGTEYWSSSICGCELGSFKVGDDFRCVELDAGEGVAYAETPQGLLQVGAHIEATRSEPIVTPEGTEFNYRITFNVRNGDYDKDPRAPEEMHVNVILRGERAVTVFKEEQRVKRGSSFGRIGRNAIAKASTAFYNEVCLTFDNTPLRWKVSGNEVCNIIQEASGAATSVSIPASAPSSGGGGTGGGDSETNEI